jgi:kynureninase
VPDSREICGELLKREVLVDWRPKAGIRMAPHFYNTDQEIDFAVAAIEAVLQERAVV